MHEHRARVTWEQSTDGFLKGRYSRRHEWAFDNGSLIPASAAEGNVPPGFADADCVDPEEAFVASIASCHLLTFLWVARKRGFVVARYDDEAVGVMSPGANGRQWVSRVTLSPVIAWEGPTPDAGQLAAMHHEAHEECFIANSVRTEIVVHPGPAETGTPATP